MNVQGFSTPCWVSCQFILKLGSESLRCGKWKSQMPQVCSEKIYTLVQILIHSYIIYNTYSAIYSHMIYIYTYIDIDLNWCICIYIYMYWSVYERCVFCFRISPRINFTGSVGYCAQSAWVISSEKKNKIGKKRSDFSTAISLRVLFFLHKKSLYKIIVTFVTLSIIVTFCFFYHLISSPLSSISSFFSFHARFAMRRFETMTRP